MAEAQDDGDLKDDDLEYGSGEPPMTVPLVAAAVAALVGAAVWAVILMFGAEIGFVAWGIGGLVGFAAVKADGSGGKLAIACAVLTLLSIFGGKLAGCHLQISASIDKKVAEYCTPAVFDELKSDARDYAELPEGVPAEQLAEFMIDHRYSDGGNIVASTSEGIEYGVTDEEIEGFKQSSAPLLVRIQQEGLTIDAWAAEVKEQDARGRHRRDLPARSGDRGPDRDRPAVRHARYLHGCRSGHAQRLAEHAPLADEARARTLPEETERYR